MATAVHDTTLKDITSSTSFQTTATEPPLRSKSCGPEVGREPAASAPNKDDTTSSATVSGKSDNGKSSSGSDVAVTGSKSATAIPSPKTKIFDNKIFVEAPIPKTNPWLKSSVNPVNKAKGKGKRSL